MIRRTVALLAFACLLAWSQPRLEPLPIREALTMRSVPFLTRLALSPDGAKLAYAVTSLGAEARPAAANEIPLFIGGSAIWVTDTASRKTLCRVEGATNWSPSWSPAGDDLVYFSNRGGASQVWLLDIATCHSRRVSDAPVRPVDGFEGARWLSDGRTLLVKIAPEESAMRKPDTSSSPASDKAAFRVYQSNRGRSGPAAQAAPFLDPAWAAPYAGDLARIDVRTGTVRRILKGYRPVEFWLSPDGSRLAFTDAKGWDNGYSDRPVVDLVVVSLNGAGEPFVVPAIRQIKGLSVSWSPDGSSLSYTTSGVGVPGDCFVVRLNGKPRAIIRPQNVGLSNPWQGPLWDASGKTLYFVAQGNLWKAPLETAAAAQAVSIPGKAIVGIVSPARSGRFYSPDNRSMFVFTRDSATRQSAIYRIDVSSGAASLLVEQKLALAAPAELNVDCAPNGFAYAAGDAQFGPDLWMFHPGGAPEKIGRLNPEIARYRMGETRLVSWQSANGKELHGALLLPAGYTEGQRYPLIVHVYGADNGSDSVNSLGLSGGASGNLQMLATRGYAVLYPDTPWGTGSPVQDLLHSVLPAIDKLVELGIADPARVGVMGGSKGGYSVLALITHTMRFRAAVMISGYGNLMGAYGQLEDNGSATSIAIIERNGMGGSPWQFPSRYIENSPVFALDKVETPLLILHGAADRRVSAYLADEVFVDLRRLGKEAEYVKYEGEGHSTMQWSVANLQDYWSRLIAWFDEHLKA